MGSRWYRLDGRTCAAGWTSDYSLCGDASEGDDDLAAVVYDRERGPITCTQCCEVISHVRDELKSARLEPENVNH